MIFQTWLEIEQLVHSFQDCTLPRDRWTHAAHLTIAGWYLLNCSLEDATTQICNRIQRYNSAMGIQMTRDSGYHETLTLFWIHTVHQFLMEQNQQEPLLQSINNLIQVCNDPRLPLRYYSRDRLFSWEARTGWLEPDLQRFSDECHTTDACR